MLWMQTYCQIRVFKIFSACDFSGFYIFLNREEKVFVLIGVCFYAMLLGHAMHCCVGNQDVWSSGLALSEQDC